MLIMKETGLISEEVVMLEDACAAVGAQWDCEREAQLATYKRELARWSERIRLVSRGDLARVVELHFVDSLRPLPYLPSIVGLRVLDLGSGAGFPGLVLKIFRPDLRMLLIESSRKKSSFLHHVMRTLGLREATALAMRAEEAAAENDHAGRYGVVLSRALGRLARVIPLSAPFLAPGGALIVFKQSDPTSELTRVRQSAAQMGFGPPVLLPEAAGIRRGSLVMFKKTG